MKTTFPKFISIQFVLSAIFSLVFVTSVFAVATVDQGFNAVPSNALTNVPYAGLFVQPDGKTVVWGTDLVANGVAGGKLIRLNIDGSLDTSFVNCECLPSTVINAGLLPDGEIIVAGQTGTAAKVIRLNANGSFDSGFNSFFAGFESASAEFHAAQPDGKVLVSVSGGIGQGFHQGYLTRLNTDGTKDVGFTNAFFDSGRLIWGYLRSVALTPSGKFYWAVTTFSGSSQSAAMKRFNADGTVDTTWEVPAIPCCGTDIQSLSAQGDSGLLVAGVFGTFNGVSRRDLVRLLPAGNVDMAFAATPFPGSTTQVGALSNGKVMVTSGGKVHRLNSDGTLDATFVQTTDFTSIYRKWALGPNDNVTTYGNTSVPDVRVFRLNLDGSNDTSFVSNLGEFGQVSASAIQPDGKVLLAGAFTMMNGVARRSLARVNADGTLDATFDIGTGPSSVPNSIGVQADGKILLGGSFTTFNGSPVGGLIRLNPNGSLDTAFAPVITGVLGVTVPTDDKIYAYGSFTTVNGATRERLVRLNADGTNDSTFTPVISSGSVYSIAIEPNGKVVVGGAFTGVDGFNRTNLVRLFINGRIDHSMTALTIPSIHSVKSLPTGKLLCLTGAGGGSGTIIRRNFDGTADTTFASPTLLMDNVDPRINSMALQPDGTIIVGGAFYSIGGVGRRNIARLTANGTVDRLFLTNGASYIVRTLENQADGKVIVGGQFGRVENSVRAGVARIIPGAFVQVTPFDFDGDGRADVSVFRPSEGRWYILQSADLTMRQVNFAIAGDIPTPADFDGDGKTDVAIYRPSNGDWWSISSVTGQQINGSFGLLGNIPLPQDVTGDGRADYVTYNTSSRKFNRISSANGSGSEVAFGLAGDKPVIGDFNGDGISDPAIYRPSDGNWWWKSSGDGIDRATKWGLADDKCVPADYTGDGRADFGIYRPSTGVWYIYDLANNTSIIYPFGTNGDRPVSADFDGDGRADTSVFRPSDGIWYLLRSTAGYTGFQWGIATDAAVPNVYVPQ